MPRAPQDLSSEAEEAADRLKLEDDIDLGYAVKVHRPLAQNHRLVASSSVVLHGV